MAKSTAELQADWWAAWWIHDFSWAGLAGKPVGQYGDVLHGGAHGEQDLQAWWRRDPATGLLRDDATLRAVGELVRGPDGRDWHIAHVPLRWSDGSAAKDGWPEAERDCLAAVIGHRVAAASETATDRFCIATAPDGRAQLWGTVLLRAPTDPARVLHAVCDWAMLPREWEDTPMLGAGFRCEYANFFDGALFRRATFSADASFNGAIFSGVAHFFRATFSGEASFNSSTFSGGAIFYSATFSGAAHFSSATLSGDASFTSATFSGYAFFDRATFSGRAFFESATFSKDAGFQSANFSKDAGFHSATFSGDAHFYSTTFSGNTRFDRATFSGEAGFHSAIFSGDVRLDSATFSGETSFYSVTFSGNTSFKSATFAGETGLNSATFFGNANFDNATFSGNTHFGSATFSGEINFNSATFSADARLDSATFSGNASFDRVTFSGNASFGCAIFSGEINFNSATFSADARFDSATFSGNASFDRVTFSGNASFDGGEFAARVSFQHAGFLFPSPPNDARSIRFRDWHFGGVTEFDHARFERRVEFTASIFARLASFQQLTWPKCLADAQGMFSQAVFKDLASFQGAGVRRFAAFDGVVLQGGLQLDDADEPTANATFHTERKEAEAYAEREAALRHLEGGCRVLKQAMEKSSNKAREQMFYAFELMARRHQRAIPWWERLISHAYGAVADYGRSIGRPLLWLVLLVPAFAAAYAGLLYGGRGEALAGPTPRVVLVECLSHSAQRVLPFGPWTLTPAQIAQSPVQSLLQGPTDALFSLAIRGLGSLQSLLALILAFLAGLSIRRRFQIN